MNAVQLQACRELMRDGSKSFFMASRLLPSAVRAPATALYAFCRVADDAIDLGEDRDAALAELEQRLDRIYAADPLPVPPDRAFARVVAAYGVPRALPQALLEGFAWDARALQYDDLAALQGYAARVAGTVGAMMATVMGVRDADSLARACDLGVAMQLTNIARDVGEDARAGRLYLPRRWLEDAGIDPDRWLAAPCFDPALASVITRLLDEADRAYARADAGIAALPGGCRPAIAAARHLYAEIGHELRRRGCDAVSQRTVVSGRHKLQVLGTMLVGRPLRARLRAGATREAARLRMRRRLESAPIDAVRFLVEACDLVPTRASKPAGRVRVRRPYLRRLDDAYERRAEWLFDLFTRLEQRDRAG